MSEQDEHLILLRELAVEYTVAYFKDKTVTEDVFMKHLETIYNFLLSGKV